MLAGRAKGVRAGDSTKIRLRINLECPALERNLVASDDAENVLAGRRMLAVGRKKTIGLRILAGFPWVLCGFRWGCAGAHLIVGVDVCHLPRDRPSAE